MWEHENHGDHVQTKQTDKLQWMTSQKSHAKQSHRSITQTNLTQDGITSQPRMENHEQMLLDVPELSHI